MATTNVYILPKNERFLPSSEMVDMISDFFRQEKFKGINLQFEINHNVQFYDCGENFENICCPYCESEIEIEWWQDEMNRLSENDFSNLIVITPCCGRESSLNKLIYKFEQGFAKFAICMENFDADNLALEKCIFSEFQNLTSEEWKLIFAKY